nr:MAG TPA: hypothetical protein [Caudoviricetes sp.]
MPRIVFARILRGCRPLFVAASNGRFLRLATVHNKFSPFFFRI